MTDAERSHNMGRNLLANAEKIERERYDVRKKIKDDAANYQRRRNTYDMVANV